MKNKMRIRRTLMAAIALIVLAVSQTGAASACVGVFHEPPVPEKLRSKN